MNQSTYCEQCGAKLEPDTRFCESCGKAVLPIIRVASATPDTTVPVMDAPNPKTPITTSVPILPRAAKRNLFVGFAIVGGIVVVVCLAIAVFGFWFSQNPSVAWGLLPTNSPPIEIVPTVNAPTNVARSATPLPTQPSSGPTRVSSTNIPLPTALSKPSPIPVTVPSVCGLTADDFKSLAGMPTDFEQMDGSGDWWDYESGKITMYGSSTKFYRQSGLINVSCTHYAGKPPLGIQIPVGYTRVDVPMIGDGVLAYQKQNYQRVRFVKGNSMTSLSLSDTASYVTSDNVVKLANAIAGRMPSTISLKQPPPLPQTVNESGFSKYFSKFELGREDSNSLFIPTTTYTSDDFMRVSVETTDQQQRYSFWITDAKQNVHSAQYGVLGTRVLVPDQPLNSGEYIAHIEIAGVIYARRTFTLK